MDREYGKQQNLLKALVGISLIYIAYYYYQENYFQKPNREELFVSTCINFLALDLQNCQDFMNKYAVFIDR